MAKLSTTLAAEPAVDLAVVQEMANELEAYIVGDDVYRTLVVRTQRGDERVQSSGGDLLARLHRLNAQIDKLTPQEQEQLAQIQKQVDETIQDMRTRCNQLLVREVKARLNSLTWYLDDCPEDRRQCRIQYPFEIRNRQRIQEIEKMLSEDASADLKGEIARVDQRIRGMTSAAAFVWDNRVAHIYPRDEYWYLYVLPAG